MRIMIGKLGTVFSWKRRDAPSARIHAVDFVIILPFPVRSVKGAILATRVVGEGKDDALHIHGLASKRRENGVV